ncbi:putative protein with domain of unknown function (DUF4470) [Lyophyllum shimeji]|uniref:Uncharacterized protein n=1 Tax=Lyophyllum shimeji TaxID=47721 RepID=A0A9P3UJX6_LYOSH|nr:putative protein with domain of unknown function (DUF4470) [Lyophyllum shimeji]
MRVPPVIRLLGQLGPFSKSGRFAHWNQLTPIVRIILVVPREKLAVLDKSHVGTPLLQCDVKGRRSMNVFTSVHVAFGRVIPMGTKNNPRVIFEEDPSGRNGSMLLVASFTMPTWLLTDLEPMPELKVSFSVRSTTGTVDLVPKLGLELHIFTASFMDEAHVHVLPEEPLPRRERTISSTVPRASASRIGTSGAALVELDEQCEIALSLTSRISVDREKAQTLLRSGAVPRATQISPCVMRIGLEDCSQDVIFPLLSGVRTNSGWPGNRYISKWWRRSMVPSSPVGRHSILSQWSMLGRSQSHGIFIVSIYLACRPSTLGGELAKWLGPHVGAMMSARERSLRKKDANDTLMAVKDTIHSVLVRSSGIQNGPAKRLFALSDGPTNNCDTIIFISDLRFDVHSHTVVCDGYVLPLTHEFLGKMEGPFSRLVSKGDLVTIRAREDEMHAWKMLLPALVERCRTWQHGEH